MYKSQQQINTTQEGHIWSHKDLKDVFRKLQRKRNFPKCCRSLPPRCRILEERLVFGVISLWFSRVFLCGFPDGFFWFGVGFSLSIPHSTLNSCPLKWPKFTLYFLMKELNTFLSLLNLKDELRVI